MYATIILDEAIDRLLDYEIPPSLSDKVEPGTRVLVPVRSQLKKGTVFALCDHSAHLARPIESLLTEKPLFTPDLFALTLWMANYYATPLRRVVTLVLPAFVRKEKKQKEQLFIKALLSKDKLAKISSELKEKHGAQASVIDVVLKRPKGIFLSELIESAGVSKSPIDTLIKKKVLASKKLIPTSAILQDYFLTKPKHLSDEQASAVQDITTSIDKGTFSPHLLYGITGSGKTEVYLQAIDHALKLGKTALILVPEIALTEQTIQRLRSRFKEKIAILHHRLSDGERAEAWKQIRSGEVKIALGARSAIFSPLPNLKLIIVDEEHDGSYKQKDKAPTYHARDVAVMRAKLLNATVVLGSATPSLESFYNAKCGRYRLNTLTKRPKNAILPEVKIVDMRSEIEKEKGFVLFSAPLLKALKERIERGEQALLFLNRRGYHTTQMCMDCSYIFKCTRCDISLTYHRGQNTLTCHLCDYSLSPPPKECPSCKSATSLKFKGAGTEQVERTLHAILPEVRSLRMDADTTRHKGAHDKLFKLFRSGKADVLIGTQMITKGLDFPSVTLVGVLNSDGGLHLPDFRAQENTFQLLAQVSGRSGRGALKGNVIIQTFLPDNATIKHAANQDYLTFYNQEIEVREAFAYPPYARFLKLTFSGKDAAKTERGAHTLRAHLIKHLSSEYEIFPVMPCGHARVKETFRFQLLIKGRKIGTALKLLQELDHPRDPRLLIDVDPLSTFF